MLTLLKYTTSTVCSTAEIRMFAQNLKHHLQNTFPFNCRCVLLILWSKNFKMKFNMRRNYTCEENSVSEINNNKKKTFSVTALIKFHLK